MVLPSSSRGLLELTWLFTYDGKVLSLPQEEVAMEFTSTANERLFSSNHVLLALLDDKRTRFGEMKYDVSVSGGKYVENMFMTISRDTLLAVANSKRAEFELGHEEFSLSDSQLVGLRKLADMMVKTPTGNQSFLEVISLIVQPDPHVPGNSEISGDVVNVSGRTLESLEAQITCQLLDGSKHDAYIVEIGNGFDVTLTAKQCAHFSGHLSGQSNSCVVNFKKGRSSVVPSTVNLREKTESERESCIPKSP